MFFYHAPSTMYLDGASPPFGERTMKLPLITASILAYIVLATAWLCYTELIP